jgi:hypothetical protein
MAQKDAFSYLQRHAELDLHVVRQLHDEV